MTALELLAIAAVWGVLTWRAQLSGEMGVIYPTVFLRRRKWPGVFTAMIAFRWFQVAGLVVVGALFATGVLPLR